MNEDVAVEWKAWQRARGNIVHLGLLAVLVAEDVTSTLRAQKLWRRDASSAQRFAIASKFHVQLRTDHRHNLTLSLSEIARRPLSIFPVM
jgi:hypothetical protein